MDLQNVFLTVWNMSLTGSIIILFVLLARLFLRKSPKVFSYALWFVVLFRLLCPVSVSSMFSLLRFTKAAEPVSQSVVTTMDYSAVEMPEFIPVAEEKPETREPVVFEPEYSEPQFETPVIPDNEVVIPEVPDAVLSQITAEPARDPIHYAVLIWLMGLGVMLIYNVYSCIRLFRQIEGAIPLRKELYLADYISTAFVLGVVKPKIYLPSYLTPEERGYIIAHERCHIKRKDHVFRLLAYLALCLHWFNPLVWLAFVQSGKDMEMSCDEAVIRMYGPRIRAEYSQSLLRLATGRRSFALTPLAFGEGDTKERVINMSKWKKPKTWATIIALVVCVAVLVACGVNPTKETESVEETHWDANKGVDQICIDGIDALLEADNYYILYEREFANDSDSIEYRRNGNDQLVICKEDQSNNRVYIDGKLALYQSEPWMDLKNWVWQGENSDYDPDAWLREWSPEYLETGHTHAGEESITLEVQWPHEYNESRYYKGSITYTFDVDGSLNNAYREAVLMEGENLIRGYIDRITVLEATPEENRAAIQEVAYQCIDGEKWMELKAVTLPSKVLRERNSVGVRTVDEFLAAIAPDTAIALEGGAYILSKASNYGQDTGSDYYYWKKVSDGYELVIRNVNNFVINGAGMNATSIETEPRYADVIKMEGCYDVFMQDFTAGHTRERGECGGDVIELSDCSSYEMSNLGLFGCGVTGLVTNEGRNIVLKDSRIYDCSSTAVKLQYSDGVTISECDIYNIGDEPAGGYAVFDVTHCGTVLIESCKVTDSSTRFMLAASSNPVTVKDCIVQDNRFEESALLIQGWDIIMSHNKFKDNSIRNWYRNSDASALDQNGRRLTEETLDEMYGTLPQTPNQKQLEVHVSTVDEFIAAIGPNKEIILDADVYDLSKASGYGVNSGDYYFWRDTYVDGYELTIRNVDNMTIRGSEGKDHHTIETVFRHANVIAFRACSNITVSGFTAGHTKELGQCTGGVLRFEDSDHILVEDCGLFGCGTKGVDGQDCADITVKNCEIYECSEGGVEFRNTNQIRLENNTFRDIAGRNYVWIINCMDAVMDGKVLVDPDVIGSVELANTDQTTRNALNDAVSNFVYYYFWDKQEEMQEFLAESYKGAGATYNDGEPSFKGMYFEITFDHVKEADEKGSVTIEIPYRPYRYEDGEKYKIIRYLLVTVIKENGHYKISNYQLKE